MGLESVVDGVLSRVEVVHMDKVDIHTSEEVTSITEDNLSALFDRDVLVLLDRVRKHIHHPDSVVETNYNLEASRVEGHTNGIVLELLVDLELEAHRRAVGPDFDGFVRGAGRNQILLYADVHT